MEKNKEAKKRPSAAKRVTALAMMTAMSVVLGIVCKNLFTFGIYYRFTLENLGVIMAGIFVGPVAGAAVGVASDVISCLLSTNPAVNPILTVGAASVGLVSGLVFRASSPLGKKGARYAISAAAAHIIGQVIVKSVGKIIMYGMPWFGVFIGAGFSAVAAAIEVTVIVMLSKNKQIMGFLNRNDDI